jgi:hypothetical protein
VCPKLTYEGYILNIGNGGSDFASGGLWFAWVPHKKRVDEREKRMQVILDTLSKITFGEKREFEGLAMIPILSEEIVDPDYLTLDEALEQKVAVITEISQTGSVPELRFQNLGDTPILLLDGEELVGAKQNRILNLSVLVPEKTTLFIPVSCVESGRWRYRHQDAEFDKFTTSGRTFFARGRSMKMEHVSKSLDTQRSRLSNQGAIWDQIDSVAESMNVVSPTSDVGDVYEKFSLSLDEYVKRLAPEKYQVGGVFGIGGEVVGLEIMDSERTFEKMLAKLIKGYALDALDSPKRRGETFSVEKSDEFLRLIMEAEWNEYPSLGMGSDLRLKGNNVNGGALVASGRLIHLSAFAK